MAWTSSNAGKLLLQNKGYTCTQVNEPSDPHTWDDNYLCPSKDIGLQWSYTAPIANMTCTQVHESVDPHAWLDNYICLPPTSPYSLAWAASENGKNSFINDGYACVQIHESADPHAWTDNHLCYRSKDNTNDQFVSSAQPKTHLAGRFAGVV